MGQEPEPQDPHVCNVCRRVLDFWRDGKGGGEWKHNIGGGPDERDHDPEPVPLAVARRQTEGVRERCDFCFVDLGETFWNIEAKTHTSVGDTVSVEDWRACEACGLLVKRNEWNALLRRLRTSWLARRGVEMTDVQVAAAKAGWRRLRKNMVGAPEHHS